MVSARSTLEKQKKDKKRRKNHEYAESAAAKSPSISGKFLERVVMLFSNDSPLSSDDLSSARLEEMQKKLAEQDRALKEATKRAVDSKKEAEEAKKQCEDTKVSFANFAKKNREKSRTRRSPTLSTLRN